MTDKEFDNMVSNTTKTGPVYDDQGNLILTDMNWFTKFRYRLKLLWGRITGKRYYYVLADITPDWNTGQGEMDSVVVLANSPKDAQEKAMNNFMRNWDVDALSVYIVECTPTRSILDILGI